MKEQSLLFAAFSRKKDNSPLSSSELWECTLVINAQKKRRDKFQSLISPFKSCTTLIAFFWEKPYISNF